VEVALSDALKIGEVARQSGVPAKTIRYYEEIALVAPAHRAENGYRSYDQKSVDTLRFIKRARDLGFGIDDVRALLALWFDPQRSAAEVKALAEAQVSRVDAKIAELQSMKRTLEDLMDLCHGDGKPDCPILDDLAGPPRT
jgi:MerR family copper efflux transcriptional regulator